MELIIRYMLDRKMTLRKLLLWLGVIPLVAVCWVILAIAWKIFEIVSFSAYHLEVLLPLLLF